MKQKATRHIELYGGFAPILILILVIALGAVGYFSYKTYVSQKFQNNNILVTPTDPTANWKTYTDTNLGYSIKYPTNYQFIDKGKNSSYITIYKPGGEVVGTDSFSHFKIFIQPDDSGSIEQAIASNQSNIKNILAKNTIFTPTKSIKIDGKVAQYYYFSGNGYTEDLFIENNGKIINFEIIFANKDVQSKEQEEVDQLLSTFKFTQTSRDNMLFGYIKSITPNYDTYLIKLDKIDLNTKNVLESISLQTDLGGGVFTPKIMIDSQQISFSKFLDLYESDQNIKSSLYSFESDGGVVTTITQIKK